ADPVDLRVAHPLTDEIAVVEDVVMAQGRALREPGRPGRVLDVDRVVEGERGGSGRDVLDGDAGRVAQQGVPGLVTDEDHVPQGRRVLPYLRDHAAVVAGLERRRRDQRADPRLVEDVLQLVRAV